MSCRIFPMPMFQASLVSFCGSKHATSFSIQRSCSSSSYGSKPNNLEQFVAEWKSSARRSLVVEDCTKNLNCLWLQNDQYLNEYLFDCHAKSIFRWRTNSNGTLQGGGKCKRFFLAEFSTESDFHNAIDYLKHRHHPPIFAQFCLINNHPNFLPTPPMDKLKLFRSSSMNGIDRYRVMSADRAQHVATFDDYLITKRNKPLLNGQQNKSEIIGKLLRGQELIPMLQRKIRFFICNQIEELLRQSASQPSQPIKSAKNTVRKQNNHPKLMDMFDLIPFGSDVSGFGDENSDIDFCFVQKNGQKVRTERSVRILNSVSFTLESSVQLPKFSLTNFANIERIFRAFVPIIKFRSRLLPSMNIDVSVDTEYNTGLRMADFLHHCAYHSGPHCGLVRAFVLILKAWAKHHEITRSIPGDWFSSFQMTILAIVFLQQRHLLPTVDEWMDTARPANLIQTDNQISETEVAKLLADFFQFVIEYHFWNHAMDLRTGQIDIPKPTLRSSACFIVNPFNETFNITKTVSEYELERFLSSCKQSLEIMQRRDFCLADLFNTINNRLALTSD